MLRDVHGPTPRMQLNQEANRDVSYPEAYHSPGSPALSPALGGGTRQSGMFPSLLKLIIHLGGQHLQTAIKPNAQS